MNAELGNTAVSGQRYHQRPRRTGTSRTGIPMVLAVDQPPAEWFPSGFVPRRGGGRNCRRQTYRALEVINEFGDEDVEPTYLCLRGGEPLHKRG